MYGYEEFVLMYVWLVQKCDISLNKKGKAIPVTGREGP
jgi:hypothetical protein